MDDAESCHGSTTSSEDHNPIGAGNTYSSQWAEGAKGAMVSKSGWELNDDQLGDYVGEWVCSP